MAEFTIRDIEGMRQVCIDIEDEKVRARSGAMSNMRGAIRLTPRLPNPLEYLRSLYNNEARIRPEYSGTGRVVLQPTLGGYHMLDLAGTEDWVLEPGIYLASESSVRLGLARDPAWASFWLGDGFFNWKTRVGGTGRVVLTTPGPVETIEITDGVFRAQGRIILGRTAGLRFTSERPASFLRSYISGQSRLRVLRGTGRVLVCFTPYWNRHLYEVMTGDTIDRSIFE
jgi:uncharacterized protein (AIM24 family)